MNPNRNPLLESVDELLGQRRTPFHRYLFTRAGLLDWAVGTLIVAVSMIISAAIVGVIAPF